MKTTVTVYAPIDKVVSLFMDKDRFGEWKKGFIKYELLSGKAGETGAKTNQVYKGFSMVETIVYNNLPKELKAVYERVQGGKTQMTHTAINRFTTVGDNQTMIEVESEINEVRGWLMKILVKLMEGAGKKYTQQQLDAFKQMVERG